MLQKYRTFILTGEPFWVSRGYWTHLCHPEILMIPVANPNGRILNHLKENVRASQKVKQSHTDAKSIQTQALKPKTQGVAMLCSLVCVSQLHSGDSDGRGNN